MEMLFYPWRANGSGSKGEVAETLPCSTLGTPCAQRSPRSPWACVGAGGQNSPVV